MRKLISGFAATVLAAGVATAGPHKVPPAHSAGVKSAKAQETNAKAVDKDDKRAIKQDIKSDKREVKQDRAELRRLRADLKAAEKAGDQRRIASDRAAIQRLEADMNGDRGDVKQDKREAKAVGKKVK